MGQVRVGVVKNGSHPLIPDWHADGAGNFEATDHHLPFKIEHGRDMIYLGRDAPEQDYNFIDYYFGDAAKPVTARHYLGPYRASLEVYVDLSEYGDPQNAEAAQRAMPAGMLAYLQKRFDEITYGDIEIWSAKP